MVILSILFVENFNVAKLLRNVGKLAGASQTFQHREAIWKRFYTI